MEKKNENAETLQKFYMQTYGEDIAFDEVKQSGKYLVGVKKQGKEQFLRGADGVKNERNSALYYFVDTAAKKDTKMVIESQSEMELPSQHVAKFSKTNVTIFSGKKEVADFYAFDAYIDTGNSSQVSYFLSGKCPGAEYSASSPEIGDLFNQWHSRRESAIDAELASDTKDVYKKYLTAVGKELKKGLLKAKDLLDIYTSDEGRAKFAQIRDKLADKVHIAKMCSKPRQVEGGKAFGTNREGRR